jgi:hypothetical protein
MTPPRATRRRWGDPRLLPLAIAVELGAGILAAGLVHALRRWRWPDCVAAAVMFHTKFGDRNQPSIREGFGAGGAFLVLVARRAGDFRSTRAAGA